MNEEDWAVVLKLFRFCRSRRGNKGRGDRQFLEALHYVTFHNITWRAPDRVRDLEFGLEALLAAEPGWRIRGLLRRSRASCGKVYAVFRVQRCSRYCESIGFFPKNGSNFRSDALAGTSRTADLVQMFGSTIVQAHVSAAGANLEREV